MKKLFLLFLFTFNFVSAQIDGEDEVYLNGDKIEAKFQGGGLSTFSEYVFKNFDKSKITKEGQLVCSFTINEEGLLKNIRIVKDLGGESAFEMIRVLRQAPKWQPAMRNGKPFSTDIQLPFKFVRKKPAEENPKSTNIDATDTVIIDAIDNRGLADDDKVYVAVEKLAQFPGGRAGFMKYFVRNFINPIRLNEVKALVWFIVNKDGSLSDVKILRLTENSEQLKSEIIRVISNSPKWTPGQQSGKVVRTQYTLPLTLIFN